MYTPKLYEMQAHVFPVEELLICNTHFPDNCFLWACVAANHSLESYYCIFFFSSGPVQRRKHVLSKAYANHFSLESWSVNLNRVWDFLGHLCGFRWVRNGCRLPRGLQHGCLKPAYNCNNGQCYEREKRGNRTFCPLKRTSVLFPV